VITTHPVTRHPGAAWLYLGSGLSSALGNAISNVVWPWLVLHRTGDPAAAGLVATCILLPSIIVATMGGDVIDRYGRKRISVISDIISAVSVVWLIAVDTTVGATLPWFIAIGIFGAVGDVPGMAARTALVGDISERSGKSLDWLAGANQSIMGVCYLVGPALAGVLLGHLPITWILWLTAACSGIAALMTWVIRLNAHHAPAEHSSVRGTVTVWRDVVKHPMLRPILIVEIVIAMAVFPYLMVILPAHFTHTYSPTTMGFALSSYAVGMIAGSIVISAVGERLRRNLLWLVAIGATAMGFLGVSCLTVTTIVVVGMFAAGCGNGLLRPIGTVVVTENVPETIRGRVFSLFSALDSFAGPIGLMATTAALQATDIYHVAVGCSLCAAVMFLWLGVMGYRTLGASQSNLQ